ncbi:hypothetical protein [Aureibacter tunicatorum]|uniref:Outer membrane protein beta-barrel domain-containing protein n=1 Tax=Aureibacter tunicatorum TaxID=866807 RepID=A0AAE3XQX9_9BACT|nr:hypothetical protein [Aureibacter tunicatorum]MDR6240413.1 hypothetical protein [Aureibacter tunicatorum]BDD05707.1 hypothetical protein AUTU_31900 [Aureibacter tunicatorum]
MKNTFLFTLLILLSLTKAFSQDQSIFLGVGYGKLMNNINYNSNINSEVEADGIEIETGYKKQIFIDKLYFVPNASVGIYKNASVNLSKENTNDYEYKSLVFHLKSNFQYELFKVNNFKFLLGLGVGACYKSYDLSLNSEYHNSFYRIDEFGESNIFVMYNIMAGIKYNPDQSKFYCEIILPELSNVAYSQDESKFTEINFQLRIGYKF